MIGEAEVIVEQLTTAATRIHNGKREAGLVTVALVDLLIFSRYF